MAFEFEFLGTGDARRVPVYGCDCPACERANRDPGLARRACSALVKAGGYTLMLDAGRTDLCETFPPGSFQAILLTHYHMDHVMGLFHLRWGAKHTVPVYGPSDSRGCDDLYKHPGILDFQTPMVPFATFNLGPLKITPLPLNHSRPVLGYCIEHRGKRLAYLTDTVWLPESSLEWLCEHRPDVMVLDCSTPPKPEPPRNHNDLTLALELVNIIHPGRTLLTHVGHQLDEFLMTNPALPNDVSVAADGMRLEMS
jgi:phosphoribosyl 1,2-cyclic phosphate phosphodiesterase